MSDAHDGQPACLGPGGSAERVEAALATVRGRWKLPILFHLMAAPVLRFSELERAIGGVSQTVLARQLREMERDGLVNRTVIPQVPPRVEYRLTDRGAALAPLLRAVRDWDVAFGDRGPPSRV